MVRSHRSAMARRRSRGGKWRLRVLYEGWKPRRVSTIRPHPRRILARATRPAGLSGDGRGARPAPGQRSAVTGFSTSRSTSRRSPPASLSRRQRAPRKSAKLRELRAKLARSTSTHGSAITIKLSMSELFLSSILGWDPILLHARRSSSETRLMMSPCFAGYELSCGVANVRRI